MHNELDVTVHSNSGGICNAIDPIDDGLSVRFLQSGFRSASSVRYCVHVSVPTSAGQERAKPASCPASARYR
jgi:hypothetical protein